MDRSFLSSCAWERHGDDDLALRAPLFHKCQRIERLVERERAVEYRTQRARIIESGQRLQLLAIGPHEALDQQTPASCYSTSLREMPNKLPPLVYPDRFEVRYVNGNGGIRWKKDWVNVSTVCIGEYVGLEEIDDGIWNVYFGALKLGRLNERHMKIEDQFGRLNRKTV